MYNNNNNNNKSLKEILKDKDVNAYYNYIIKHWANRDIGRVEKDEERKAEKDLGVSRRSKNEKRGLRERLLRVDNENSEDDGK